MVYQPLAPDTAEDKVRLLQEHYPSQRHRPWYDREAFLGLARIRGIESNARYAEAFAVTKLTVDLADETLRVLLTGHPGYVDVIASVLRQAAGHEVVGLDAGLFADCVLGPRPADPPGTQELALPGTSRPTTSPGWTP
ncbi:hypothetical protein SALBM217S_05095 [Streptomyces griseoloalbus]